MIKAIKTRQLNSLLTLLGAAACGLSMLSACYEYNEEYIEADTSVTSQLLLSVSGSNATRMTEAATQSDETFRGMQDITLIPFIKSGTDDNPITATDRCLSSYQSLDDLNGFEFASNSKLYDISLPYGTNAFLVYGRSKAETNGQLTPTWGNYHAADISFSPVQIVSSVTADGAAGAKGNAIIAYLNIIFDENWADKTNYPLLNGFYTMVQDMKAGSSAVPP